MTVIGELFQKYESERNEGILSSLWNRGLARATGLGQREIAKAKEAILSTDFQRFKSLVDELGLVRFLDLYDDKFIGILKHRAKIASQLKDKINAQIKLISSLGSDSSIESFLSVLSTDPVLWYLTYSDAALKEEGLPTNDKTLIKFRQMLGESRKSGDITELKVLCINYLRDLLRSDELNPVELQKKINSIKSRSNLTLEKLFSILDLERVGIGRNATKSPSSASIAQKIVAASLAVVGAIGVAAINYSIKKMRADEQAWNEMVRSTHERFKRDTEKSMEEFKKFKRDAEKSMDEFRKNSQGIFNDF